MNNGQLKTKKERLRSLSTESGIIAALAMDQRKSLRRMIAHAASATEADVPDTRLGELKSAVTKILSPHASAILLDSEYGLGTAEERGSLCGLLLANEADGYDNPRPHRMLALDPRRAFFIVLGVISLPWVVPWLRFSRRSSTSRECIPCDSGSVREILKSRSSWGTFAGDFCGNYVWFFLLIWLPSYLVKDGGFSIQEMTSIGSIAYFVIASGTLCAG